MTSFIVRLFKNPLEKKKRKQKEKLGTSHTDSQDWFRSSLVALLQCCRLCWRTRSLCVRFWIWSVSLETTRMVGRKNKRNKWRASRVLHVGSQASGISFLRCVCVCVCVFIPFGFPNEMTWLIRVKDVSGDWTMTPKWRTSPQPTRNNGSAQSIQEWLRLDTLLLAFAVFLPVPPSLVESKSVSKKVWPSCDSVLLSRFDRFC